MGEYFSWVNVDKKEYIQPGDFDLGQKSRESAFKDNIFLRALYELLSTDWKGCHIIFLGDECNAPDNNKNYVIDTIIRHSKESECSGYLFDTVYETYKNVSGLFKATEKEVRNEIGYYLDCLKSDNYIPPNEYGIDIQNPYEGLFLRLGKTFRYTINHTKKVYYSIAQIKVLDSRNNLVDRIDPLPVLFRYGKYGEAGSWIGDIIEVSDSIPSDCTLLDEIKIDW